MRGPMRGHFVIFVYKEKGKKLISRSTSSKRQLLRSFEVSGSPDSASLSPQELYPLRRNSIFHNFTKDDSCLFHCQVADDGYGVSYIVAGEDTIFYHITCKVSSQLTVSTFALCRVALTMNNNVVQCELKFSVS